jgi:hemerythrin-like domain-containing protein
MSLLEMLVQDHRAFRGLLEQIAEIIDDDPEGARLLVKHARIAILAHGRAEGRVLYVEISEDAHQAREEHAVVEALLDDLAAALVVDDAYRARVQIITDLLDRHIADEEQALFPKARRAIGARRLGELADVWLVAKARELTRLGDDDAAEALIDGREVVRGID